ncbi:GNAT family N-acetyltransferase [Dechloromonas sp. ZY10]|uniref:GNAT family N-acetyltransferase n=1 Tax=Dechloromonas aquae TaxID=2664436 RepID=UPI00352714B7
MPSLILHSDRLELCHPEAADFPELHAILADPETMAQAFAGQPLSEAAARDFFRDHFDWTRTGRRAGVLRCRGGAEIIGFAGLLPCSALGADDYEIGFVLARRHWGRGYAQEIGHAQLAYGFTQLNCPRMLAQVAPDNLASRKALEKLGMHLHGSTPHPLRGERLIYLKHRPPGC